MTIRKLTLSLCAVVALGVLAPSTAFAQSGEARRLIGNMKSLAEKNAWTGVERNYSQLLDLKEEVPFNVHMLGAQAASSQGKVLEWYERLVRARDAGSEDAAAQSEVEQNITAIEGAYGKVDIKGKPAWHPTLHIKMMPFSPDQRRAVEYAQKDLKGAGSFRGMLPAGEYCFGSQAFQLGAGGDFTELKVKGKDLAANCSAWGEGEGAAPPPPDNTGDGTDTGDGSDPMANNGGDKPDKPPRDKPPKPDGADSGIIYAGPIVVIGGGLASSGKPADLAADPDDAAFTVVQPVGINSAGLAAELGGEIGLSYFFGVAATAGYNGGYGDRTVHNVNGTVSGVFRTKVGPGDIRVLVGPSYGYYRGRGLGVHEDVARPGLDTNLRDPAEISFKGRAFAAGAALSAGYAFLDLDPLQGVLEVGGSYKYDNTRGWLTAGVRVGIVPKVPRYTGE